MHEAQDLLRNLALVLAVAAVTTVLFERLKQPVVFGYMLAGLIIGPNLPIPLVADQPTVRTLSELGVILLMFSLGLEFSLRRLVSTGWTVVIVAVLQSSLMLWLGFEAGRLMGWSVLASLYAGAAIAISSTTIIIKAFSDQGAKGRFTELVVGILLIEDLIAILLLALLTPASSGASAQAAPIALTVVRLVSFLVGFLVLGTLLIPRLVRFVVGLNRSEITLVVSIGICFATSALAQAVGYSVALGAFIAGSLIAESGEERRIAHLVEPIRDMFAAVFFVSVGMMIDPGLVARHWLAVLGFVVLVIVGKIGAVSLATFLTGAGTRTAVRTGMSLGQIGEFSFIIAGVGLASGAAPSALYPIIVAVSAVTTLTTPWLIRSADPAAAWIDSHLPRPLQTFAALYGTWIESLREQPSTSADKLRLRRAVRGLAIDAAVIVAVSIGASVSAEFVGQKISTATGLRVFHSKALVAVGAVLMSLPFLVGIVRSGRALGQILSRRAFPDPEPGKLDLAAAPRRAMVVAIQVTTMMLVVTPLLAVTQPFLPAFTGFILLLAALAVIAIIVWRTAADLQGHVRAAAEVIVDAIGVRSRREDPKESERALQRAYQLLPGLGEPFPVRIHDSSPAVGRSLADLGLRGRTGATIIAISRGNHVVLVPDGHERLVAGDVVALAGTREAIESAKALLITGQAGGA